MNRESVKRTIEALEEAYYHILTTVPPGTPGKIDAVMRLRNNAENLFVEYANHNIHRDLSKQQH